MPEILNPVRKGDVVAIEVTHSSTSIDFKREVYKVWHLAYVERASREGECREIRFAGQSHALRSAGIGKIYPISGARQLAARKLAEAMPYPGIEYQTADELRQAILAA